MDIGEFGRSSHLCGHHGQPYWELLSTPYEPVSWLPAPAVTYPQGFPNGTPPPTHTFDGVEFIPPLNSFVTLGHDSSNLPVYASMAWLFNLDTKSWSGPYPHQGGKHVSSAWDPSRELLWYQPQHGSADSSRFASFYPFSKQFSYYEPAHTSPYVAGLDAMMGYDPLHDRLVITNFRDYRHSIAERDLNDQSTVGISPAVRKACRAFWPTCFRMEPSTKRLDCMDEPLQ